MEKRIYLLLLLSCINFAGAHAQLLLADDELAAEVTLKPLRSGEELYLISDRDLYTVAEDIYVSVYYAPPAEAAGLPWSKILYLELIKWDGTRLCAAKAVISDGFAAAKLRIPANVLSGNYYLKAYTRWMRNFSPYSYEYLPVKIINPGTSQLEPGPRTNISLQKQSSILETSNIKINGLQSVYRKHDRVRIRLSSGGDGGTFTVGIAKAVNKPMASFSFVEENKKEVNLNYLPEINGMTLSGKLVEKDSDIPVPNTTVQLSTYPNSAVYAEVETDARGVFLFSLPQDFISGEMHIAEKPGGEEDHHDIFIESEFCTKAVALPFIPFELDEDEKTLAREIIINSQLMSRYSRETKNDEPAVRPFYGTPFSITYVRDFIELHDLKEFFYELIQHVSIRTEAGKSHLVVHGQSSLDPFPPLILLDNIPVPNDEALLSLHGRQIERIELLNRGYMVGKSKYSGLISIYSKDRDMAGLKLNNSHFFNFTVPEEVVVTIEVNIDNSIPDRRNLLYWDPMLEIEKNGYREIEFVSPESAGKYVLTVYELGPDGVLKSSGLVFEVR